MVQQSHFCLVVFLIVLAACGAPKPEPNASTLTRIDDEITFRKFAIGKTLSDSQGSVIFASDGTYEGRFSAGRFHGTWRWRDGYLCREGWYGGREIRLDCKLIEIGDTFIHLIGARGRGQTVVFQIN